MRRSVCSLAALLVLPLLGSDSPKEYDDRTEMPGIEGKWEWVSATQDRSTVLCSPHVVAFHDGIYTENGKNYFDGKDFFSCLTYRTNLTCKPSHLDIFSGHFQGRVTRSIFKIEGNILTIADWGEGRERPKGFDDKGVVIAVYKRVK